MNKQEFYAQLPRIRKRLFLFGIPAAAVFLVVWYLGGYHLWGRLLDGFMAILVFPMDLHYEPGSTAQASLVYSFEAGGRNLELNYLVNQLSSNLVVLVTLLATWPHASLKRFFILAGWCLLFILIYMSASVVVQLQYTRIGPDVASSVGIFWDDNLTYRIVRKLSAFDKFILRYFAWIPVFLASLVTMYFLGARSTKRKVKKPVK